MANQLTAFQSKYTAQEIENFFDDINNGEFVPTIGEDGTWWINGKSTGVKAAGGGGGGDKYYGFIKQINNPDPFNRIKYIGKNKNFIVPAGMNYHDNVFQYGDWKNWFFLKGIHKCLLGYDGTVLKELDLNNATKDIDGNTFNPTDTSLKGNIMIAFPKIYVKRGMSGQNSYHYFAKEKLDDDYECYAHHDHNGDEVPYFFYPAYKGSLVDGRLRSLSGQRPESGTTAQQEIDYALANNPADSAIWYTRYYSADELLKDIGFLLGCSTDSQSVYGYGHCDGGSGAGSLITTGALDKQPFFYGTTGNDSIKFLGMENYYADRWDRIAGWVNDKGTQKIKLTWGQEDGSRVTGYNLDGSNYITIPNSAPSGSSGGYISSTYTNKYGTFPISINGSASTYETDGCWFNNSQNNYALAGGRCDSGGARCGLACSFLNNGAGVSYWGIGASISCLPNLEKQQNDTIIKQWTKDYNNLI